MRRSVEAGLAVLLVLVLGAGACSDDGDTSGSDSGSSSSDEDGGREGSGSGASSDVSLPVPPLSEAPGDDPCDLFTGLVGEDAIAEALGSDIDTIEPADWAGADTSWTASCVASGSGREGSESATVSLTLSTAALPAGTEEVEGIEGAFLDPELSVVTWAHEGLNISLRVNNLPRDDEAAAADDEAATTLAQEIDAAL